MNVGYGDQNERVRGEPVSGNYFEHLGFAHGLVECLRKRRRHTRRASSRCVELLVLGKSLQQRSATHRQEDSYQRIPDDRHRRDATRFLRPEPGW